MHARDAHPPSSAHSAHRERRGFTIIELMIVVVITGILAAIAIPTFQGYLHKSRTTEATEFLAEIKSKQEFYRAEFNRYATQGAGESLPADATFKGMAVPSLGSFTAGSSVAWPGDASFNAIGARPDGQVRFGYAFVAGLPGSATSIDRGFDAATADHWFVARAWGDLDGDSNYCTFELMSHTRTPWFSPDKGWE